MDPREVVEGAAWLATQHLEKIKHTMQAAVDPNFPRGWGDAEYAIVEYEDQHLPAWCFREIAYPLPKGGLLEAHGNTSILETNFAEWTWRVVTLDGQVEHGPMPVPENYL